MIYALPTPESGEVYQYSCGVYTSDNGEMYQYAYGVPYSKSGEVYQYSLRSTFLSYLEGVPVW